MKERNTAVAQKWAELSDDERKAWSMKAEALSDPTFVTQPEDVSLDPQEMTPEQVNSALIENTLLRIQEKVHTHRRRIKPLGLGLVAVTDVRK